MRVLSVKPDHFTTNGEEVKCWKVELDDRTKPVPCYDPAAEKLEVGKDLPEGWEVRVSKKNKDYLFVPKPKGGGGFTSSWYNSEEGVRFTQQKTDRRTALMQAVSVVIADPSLKTMEDRARVAAGPMVPLADAFYNWLRGEGQQDERRSDGADRTTDPNPATSSASTSASEGEGPTEGAGTGGGDADKSGGSDEAASSSPTNPWEGMEVDA